MMPYKGYRFAKAVSEMDTTDEKRWIVVWNAGAASGISNWFFDTLEIDPSNGDLVDGNPDLLQQISNADPDAILVYFSFKGQYSKLAESTDSVQYIRHLLSQYRMCGRYRLTEYLNDPWEYTNKVQYGFMAL